MKRSKLLALCMASCIAVSSLLFGCNAKEDAKNAADNVKNGVEDIGEGVKEGTESLVDKITDDSMTYNEDDFKKELQNQGVNIQKVENSKPLFSVDSDDYILSNLNNQKISIYQYEEGDKDKIRNDIASIKDNGTTINGQKVTWNAAPHIYKKGRLLVVYDGEDSGTLDTLRDLLGIPVLG